MKNRTVAVIGAGPSGITTIKNFADLDFDVTGFDLSDGVGGNWRYDDASKHSSVFETTHIISSKYTSQYEDYPLPSSYADYPSHKQLFAYFTGYADRFGINSLIRFKTEVVRCEPTSDGKWEVTWRKVGTTDLHSEVFDALCVCNGHHHTPRMPSYPGQFSGDFLHSHDYKKAEPFRGKRVLVIGGGNSACDVAVETARISAKTSLSWRRGYYLIPKIMFGMPTDKFFYQFRWLPVQVQKLLLKGMLRLLQGRNRDIGLPDPDHPILATHPTLNSDLYLSIRHGKVQPKCDIKFLDGKSVVFADNSVEEYDVIIACTGYHISHPFLDPKLFDASASSVRLYLRMMPEKLQNLYFIGLFQPLGCIWPGSELQAKLAARHLAGLWSPSDELTRLIDRELANPDVHQVDSPRHTITVNDFAFRKRLRRELARAKCVPAPAGARVA